MMYRNQGKQIIYRDAAANGGSGETTHIADAGDVEKADFLVKAANAYGTSGYERVLAFHEAFSLPVNGPGYEPTVEERLLRGRLMLEEVLEHLCTGLGLTFLVTDDTGSHTIDSTMLSLVHLDGDPYNPVETLDGLCDVKVIANATGVAFGLPVQAADTMIYKSNMSKLLDGKPIINGVTPGYRALAACHTDDPAWHDEEPGYRADLPHGKVLKPDHYVAPDIASLL